MDGEGKISLQRVRATEITCGKDTNKQKTTVVKKIVSSYQSSRNQ